MARGLSSPLLAHQSPAPPLSLSILPLRAHVQDLKSPDPNVRTDAAAACQQQLTALLRELTDAAIRNELEGLSNMLTSLAAESSVQSMQAAVLCIEQVILAGLPLDSRICLLYLALLSRCFQAVDIPLATEAARVHAMLCSRGGLLMLKHTETILRATIFEALEGKRIELRRHIAVLILCDFVKHCPKLMAPYQFECLQRLPILLSDQKSDIRECAAEALGHLLEIIKQAVPPLEDQVIHAVYVSLFEASEQAVQRRQPQSAATLLLVARELALHADDFLVNRLERVYDLVLDQLKSSDTKNKALVMRLLPQFANYNLAYFRKAGILDRVVPFFLSTITSNQLGSTVLDCIGQLSAFLPAADLSPHVGSIMEKLKPLVFPADSSISQDSTFDCILALFQSLDNIMARDVDEILAFIDEEGFGTFFFSPSFASFLNGVKSCQLPSSEKATRVLFDYVGWILAKRRFNWETKQEGAPAALLSDSLVLSSEIPPTRRNSITRSVGLSSWSPQVTAAPRLISDAELQLAMEVTVSNPDVPIDVCAFICAHHAPYLKHHNSSVRLSAVATCCYQLFEGSFDNYHQYNELGLVLALLSCAVTDPEPLMRKTILQQLISTDAPCLRSTDCIHSLVFALNDTQQSVRLLAAELIGRASGANPAAAEPILRRVLIEALLELEFESPARKRSETFDFLASLLKHSHSSIDWPVDLLAKKLFAFAETADKLTSCSIIACLGVLAEQAGPGISKYETEYLNYLESAINDIYVSSKRLYACRALATFISHSGCAIKIRTERPWLVSTILRLLCDASERPDIRHAASLAFGLLGSADPLMFGPWVSSDSLVSKAEVTWPEEDLVQQDLAVTDTNFYLNAVFESFHRTLEGAPTTSQVSLSFDAIATLFRVLRWRCSSYLSIVPLLLNCIKAAPLVHRDHHLSCLLILVTSVGQHLVPYTAPLMSTISAMWTNASSSTHVLLLDLIEALSILSPRSIDSFRDLMSLFARLLEPKFMSTNPTHVCVRVLKVVPQYSKHLEDYMHLLYQSFCQTLVDTTVPIEVRETACRCLETLAEAVPSFKLHAQLFFGTFFRLLQDGEEKLQDAVESCSLTLLAVLDRDVESFIPSLRRLLEDRPSVRLLEALRMLDQGGAIEMPRHGLSLESKSFVTPYDSKLYEPALTEPPCHFELIGFLPSYNELNTDDWLAWFTSFASNLVKAAPSFALQAVSDLAESSNSFAMSLLDYAMLSCYRALNKEQHAIMLSNLHAILDANTAPTEICQRLLSCIEFMERKGVPLNMPLVDLARFAYKCNSLSKALRFTELQYLARPTRQTIKHMVSLSAEMLTPDSGVGILAHARGVYGIESEPYWLEKLGRWDLALQAYEKMPADQEEAALGKLKCLNALQDWDSAYEVVKNLWSKWQSKGMLSPYALDAAWGVSDFVGFPEYLNCLPPSSPDLPFYSAILAVHYDDFRAAQVYLANCRTHLDVALQPSLKDSYSRAYPLLVRAQMLAELEEVVRYKQLESSSSRQIIQKAFEDRLELLSPTPEVFDNILRVHALIIPPKQDVHVRSRFADIARQHDRKALSAAILRGLLTSSLTSDGRTILKGPPEAIFSNLRLMHIDSPEEARRQLRHFAFGLPDTPNDIFLRRLKSRALRRLGDWSSNAGELWHANVAWDVIAYYQASADCDPSWYKAFACLAVGQAALAAKQVKTNGNRLDDATLHNLVVPAIQNFFSAIEKADQGQKYVLQDLLRLFDLLHTYGEAEVVSQTVVSSLHTIPLHLYLLILPQILARIDASNRFIRKTIHQVLHALCQPYANALVYPLGVASKDTSRVKREAAQALLSSMRQSHALLVEHAALIGQELIRVSVSWLERWHTGLEQASKSFYNDADLVQMFNQLDKLHEELHPSKAETPDEAKFVREFGPELDRAAELSKRYRKYWKIEDLNEAWSNYYKLYRTFNAAIGTITAIDLKWVTRRNFQILLNEHRTASPRLAKLQNVALGVPGAFQPHTPLITISRTLPAVLVFLSKQKPRKLSFIGSDGQEYPFLLKGHEDLRLDERVMQLLDLCNRIFRKDRNCRIRRLKCVMYSVVPLSSGTGLLTWLRNKDTMHVLIKEYRASRNIPLDQELRYMRAFAPQYEQHTLMQKVEIFEQALEKTNGQDLYSILWIKSSSTETWLERRTSFSRSLASMSMVGYILGLGDRHPSNILIDRISGCIVHVDYSDSFEVARERERFPETVPFRLTRMMVLAQEVSGVEGTFRMACESSLKMLRSFKESIIILLQAFVEDPVTASFLHSKDARAMKKKALQVLGRVQVKLTGRDFRHGTRRMESEEQVDNLIAEATANTNLAALYQGWCESHVSKHSLVKLPAGPFW